MLGLIGIYAKFSAMLVSALWLSSLTIVPLITLFVASWSSIVKYDF